jgi:hypothetical protein
MIKRIFFCIAIAFIGNAVKAQHVDIRGLDVSIDGYIFLTDNGLFFQPLDYLQKKDFISSLNKLSFRIDEPTDAMNYSTFLKAVGHTLIVQKDLSDTINKKNIDTINYFRCSIVIGMQFFDTSYTKIDKYGFGFFLKKAFFYYGNLSIKNQLYKIIPDDVKVIEQFYNSYQKKKITPPEWLRVLYVQRKVKIK